MEASHLAKYLEPTRCSAEEAVVLGIKTLKGAPARPTAAIRVAIGGVHEKTVALQDVVLERMRSSPESLVPLNIRLSNGWMGLAESLGALTRLDGTEVAARAARMLRTLFPRGTGFVKGSHARRVDDRRRGPEARREEEARARDPRAGRRPLPALHP